MKELVWLATQIRHWFSHQYDPWEAPANVKSSGREVVAQRRTCSVCNRIEYRSVGFI